jgi:hypothetical protein
MKPLASPLTAKCEATTGGKELPESSTNTAAVSNSMRSADNEEARVMKPLTRDAPAIVP